MVTDIVKFYEVLYILSRFVLSLKNSVNKTLPTLGNEKEQILQKIFGRVDFLLGN